MSTTRRAILAAPFFIRNLISAPPSGRVRVASMGANGMAWATLNGIGTHASVDIVAAADVDTSRTERVKKGYPNARHYQDWRQMLDKEHKELDAVCVGTPDHMHAPQAMSAMRRGLHVYCQKPLTSHVAEARALQKYAAEKLLVTQMGIQVHSKSEYLTAVQMVHDGVIGKVREVHAWSNKKWGDTAPRPSTSDEVPSTLDWDGWIGVARPEPYIKNYCHPGNWRKRLEFGTGTFGDMGCHIYDPVFGALGLTAPLTVRAEGPAPNDTSWAVNAIVKYTFPGTQYTEGSTVNVTWYDGDERPPREIQALIEDAKLPDQGSIIIGTKGVMLVPHVEFPALFPRAAFNGYKRPEIQSVDHYHEFVDVVLGKGRTSTPFSYSGPLSETVLLGSLATRFPKTTLEWNSAKLKFRNEKQANAFLRRPYRNGWKVKGL
ncbi:MAG TPA: Gfo/Idh/MocA family oxidoreductase [Bryobacteraceae bacterium]|nr:Gfo/Idh/MocA family oxidoreductase [Bryobacteraceae bacterium]